MYKYAGVTLDYYDDGGAFIKECFPTPDKLPDVIKTANVKPPEQLSNEQFALVALDSGHILRKFACVDPGTTAMSVMYFLQHGGKLPEDAIKTAATNLFNACINHGLLPPAQLTKLATDPVSINTQNTANQLDQSVSTINQAVPGTVKPEAPPSPPTATKEAGVLDITDQRPKTKFASKPLLDEDYAVITDDGKRLYPIHDWDSVKLACDYWAEQSKFMEPELRRQFAVKVAHRALMLGYPVRSASLLEAGSPGYGDNGQLRASVEMRKLAMPEQREQHKFLDELVEKTASISPEVYAEVLRRFDVQNGLDAVWDHSIPSPWESTFGLQKIAKVVWESGNDRVTDYDLNNLARNKRGDLDEVFYREFTKEFTRNPVGAFNKLPEPHKKVLARLANDMASQGGSVMQSENEF